MNPEHMAFRPAVPDQIHHGGIVDPAVDHRIDLDRVETGPAGRFDSAQNIPRAEAVAGHLPENIFIQSIQADRDPVQARLAEGGGFFGQRDSVGGQGEIFDPRQGGKFSYQGF